MSILINHNNRQYSNETAFTRGRVTVKRRTPLKPFVVLILSVLLVAVFAGCGGNGASTGGSQDPDAKTDGDPSATPEDDITIAFALPTLAQWRWQFDRDWFIDEAERLGAKVIVQSAEDDEAVQANQVETMLAQQPDVLVLGPVNVETAHSLVNMARADGVPVVSYNYFIDNADIQYFVARDNKQVGVFTAEMALEARPGGNFVIASGDPGTDVAQEWTAGVMEVLEPAQAEGKIRIVSQEFHRGWDPALALAQVEAALVETNNQVDAVLGTYDGFTLAAMEALEEAGLIGKTWIGGQDVFDEKARAIVEGRAHMSAYTDLEQMARAAARAAVSLARGEEPEGNEVVNGIPGTRVDSYPVTAENMCTFLKETGWFTLEEVYVNVPVPDNC